MLCGTSIEHAVFLEKPFEDFCNLLTLITADRIIRHVSFQYKSKTEATSLQGGNLPLAGEEKQPLFKLKPPRQVHWRSDGNWLRRRQESPEAVTLETESPLKTQTDRVLAETPTR